MLITSTSPARFNSGDGLQAKIPKTLLGTSLASCLVSLLAGGSAQATTISICDFGGGSFGHTACATSGPGSILDIGDKRVTITSLPSFGVGTINFQNLVEDFFTVRATFQPALLPPVANATFAYDVEIISGQQTFKGVQLSVDAFGSTSVTKTETSATPRFHPLASTNSSSPIPSFPQLFNPILAPGITKLSIRDTYSLASPSGLTSFTNTFQQSPKAVPGPLPVMGASLAFAFSRKLRSRIQARTRG